MRSGRRGDMGFTEAMLSTMAVVMVLTAYVAASASMASVQGDLLEGFDLGELDGRVEDGSFVPSYGGYLEEFVSKSGCSGVSVRAEVPGGFASGDVTVFGDMDGPRDSVTHVSSVDAGGGRRVPTVFEVTVCR